MSVKPNVKEVLRELGFSDYNIIIYHTLLKEKELDARELSQKTKVPYSRIYEILNEMIDKGIIIKLDGRPSTYIPKSPMDVLQGIQQNQEEKFMVNSTIVKEPLMSLYSETRSAHTTPTTITYGQETNLVHLNNMINHAVRSVNLILTQFDTFCPNIIDELKVLPLKNVKSRFILPETAKNSKFIKEIAEIGDIRYIKIPPVTLLIADDQNTIILASGEYLKNVSEDMIGITFAHAATNFISKQLFDNIWQSLE